MYWLFFCVQHSILYPILCALTTVFVHILYFSAVSPFKVFPTACSSQYCSRQFLPIRMNFLSLFHSIVGFFFLQAWDLPCCLSYAHCLFLFILGTEQASVSLLVLFQFLNKCFPFPLLYFFIFSPSVFSSYSTSLTWLDRLHHWMRPRKTCLLL